MRTEPPPLRAGRLEVGGVDEADAAEVGEARDAFAGGGAAQVADLTSTAFAGVLLVAFWFVVGSALLARREIP